MYNPQNESSLVLTMLRTFCHKTLAFISCHLPPYISQRSIVKMLHATLTRWQTQGTNTMLGNGA